MIGFSKTRDGDEPCAPRGRFCQFRHARWQGLVDGVTITATALIIIPLAVVATGIRRQERAPSLSEPAPDLAAAITRKLLALHTDMEPAPAPAHRPARRASAPATAQARP